MERSKNGQREGRLARTKQLGQQGSGRQSSLRANGDLETLRTRGKDRNNMKAEDKSRQRPTASSFSTQDQYVQRWLARTTQDVDRPSNTELSSRKENFSRSVGQEGLSRGLDFEQFLQGRMYDSNEERAGAKDKPHKRMLESSSGCSFLERALSSDPLPKTHQMDNLINRIEEQKESKTRRQRRKLERSSSLEDSVVSLSIKTQVESFEKRGRHKTREDRYEPKRALVDPEHQVNRQKKGEKKEKKKSRRKVPWSNGKELMPQFYSKSVGLDRLTMRPSHTVGLFKNGRASSPGRHRGLPDLAFSEMWFLKRSKQRPVEMDESKPLSKSQEKERRRSERAQNEISEYFKPSRTLPDDVEQSDRQQASYMASVDRKLHQTETSRARYPSSSSKSTSQSIGFSKEPLFGMDRRRPLEQLAPMLHSGQMEQPTVAPDTVKNLSDRVTSYYTWSDSVVSPEASERNRTVRSEASTTPESIRQMLNDTGIFANTGIHRSISRPREIISKEVAKSHVYRKPQRLPKGPNYTSSSPHSRRSSHTRIQGQQLFDTGETHSFRDHHKHQEELRIDLNDNVNSGIKSRQIMCPATTVVQHYSPRSGWRENLTNGKAEIHHLAKGEASHQGMLRHVIAQEAYVKLAPRSSAAALRTDATEHTTLSAETPEVGLTTTHQQLPKQLIYQKSNVETVDHSPPLKIGEKKPRGVTSIRTIEGAKSPADPHIDHRGPLRAMSDSQSKHQLDGMLVPGVVSFPFPILGSVPNLPTTNHEIKGSLVQNCETRLEGHNLSMAPANPFGGLPVRGSWPGRANGSISASHAALIPLAVEPLYNYQLQKSVSRDLADQVYVEGNQTGQLPDRFYYSLDEYSHDFKGGIYDTFEGEQELLNSSDNLTEYDIMVPNEIDTGAFMAREEEDEQTLYREMTLQAAPKQHFHETAQRADSLNQQYLQVVGPNSDMEARPYHPSCESVREHVREEDGVGHHWLTRFWLPRRQY